MFDKIKMAQKLYSMKSKTEKQLAQIFHQEEKGTNLILIRGDKKFEKIVIDGMERKDIKDLLNDAVKHVEKKSEKKLQDQASDLMSMMGMS